MVYLFELSYRVEYKYKMADIVSQSNCIVFQMETSYSVKLFYKSTGPIPTQFFLLIRLDLKSVLDLDKRFLISPVP